MEEIKEDEVLKDEQKEISTEILKMIFAKYPNGISVEKVKHILNQVEQNVESIEIIID